MGNKNGKSLPLDGDEKYMASRFLNCMQYMPKWKKKYGVEGKLRVEVWKIVVDVLEESVDKKKNGLKKKRKERELDCAKVWLKASQERKEQIQKTKDRKMKGDEAETMFVRPEDNEAGVRRRTAAATAPADAEGAARAVEQEGLSARTQNLYPSLTNLQPPPYNNKRSQGHITRSPVQTRSLTTAARFSQNLDKVDVCPMIQVPNPNVGEGQLPHTYVFRPWTLEEARKAVEGVTPVAEDPAIWAEDMAGIIHSYRLNGHEAGEAAMSSLGKDWAKVRGNYTGRNNQGPFPYPVEGNQLGGEYAAQWNGLVQRVRTIFQRRANYGHLAGIKQKPGEDTDDFRLRFEKEFRVHSGIPFNDTAESAYQQQLKNALLTNFRPEIGNWVRKHLVEVDVASVTTTMQWARHAEKVIKKGKSSDVFHLDNDDDELDEDTTVFFQGSQQARGRSRGQQGRRPPYNSKPPRDSDKCWNCGKRGHLARVCRSAKQYQSKGAGRGGGRAKFSA
nr:glycine receptor subunit alpha-3 isoform X4 [Syngnathus scovelli]